MIIRCSSLPILWRCAEAGRSPEIDVRDWGEAAGGGSACHHVLADLPRSDAVDWDALPQVCARYGVAEADVRPLVASGVRLWRDGLAAYFLGGTAEVPMTSDVAGKDALVGAVVVGHADILSQPIIGEGGERVLHVLDWKSGRVDSDYRPQLLGYCALALMADPWASEAVATIAWLRDGEVERCRMRRDELPAWNERIGQIASYSGGFRTGSHCTYCPRAHECPGRVALAKSDARSLLDLTDDEIAGGLATMDPKRKLELYRQAKRVASVADRLRDAIKLDVQTSGDIVTEDGRLTITTESRRAVSGSKAGQILQPILAGFDDDAYDECVTVRLSKVEEHAAKAAGRGKGAQAKRDLNAALEAAGALRTTEIRKLTERRS